MKRKVLLSVLMIILILTLIGCEIMPPCCTEEMKAKQEVYLYWQAIINRQYVLAKLYCVIGGIWDNKVDEWEEYINTNSEGVCSMVMIYFDKFYKPTGMIENNAVVYARIIVDKIVLPCKKMNGMDIDVFEYETELIKQNYPYGDWKLK